MKELSIKKKAKRYDEVIEELRGLLEGIHEDKCNIMEEDIIKIFPELKESEDERIRKELLNAFQEAEDSLYMVLSPQRRKSFIAWLEKQGKNNMSISEATKQVLEDNLNKALEKETPESCNEFLEKQGEQKPADKVEPKFKVKKNEWYVCTDTFVSRGKIIAIKGQTYQSKQEDNTITCEDNCLFIDRHDGKASDYFRLWTIDDAKDGDVLVASDDSIFLFTGVFDCACKYYAALTTDGAVKFNEGLEHFWETSRAVHPATKEQRNLLFQKIKEKGYEWDAEKKELKKIEQKPADNKDYSTPFDIEIPFGAKDSELIQETIRIPDGCYAFIEGNEIVIKKGEKPAWSEEDEEMLIQVIEDIVKLAGPYVCYRKDIEWLKSLKERYTWKPSDEQMEALDEVYKTHSANNVCRRVLFNLMNDLKKLKGE